jgi:hypothetical protein
VKRRNFLAAAVGAVLAPLGIAASPFNWAIPGTRRKGRTCYWTGAVSHDAADQQNWRHFRAPRDGDDVVVAKAPHGMLFGLGGPTIGTLTLLGGSACFPYPSTIETIVFSDGQRGEPLHNETGAVWTENNRNA